MIGIFPGWILIAALLAIFTDIPPEMVIAGSAAGLAVSVAFVTKSSQAKASLLSLLIILATRLVLKPMIPAEGMVPAQSYDWAIQLLISDGLLIIVSLLSLIASTIAAYSWIFHGNPGRQEDKHEPKALND